MELHWIATSERGGDMFGWTRTSLDNARKHEFGPHGYLEVSGTSTMSIVPVDTAPVIRETLVAATQADIQNCFASYPDTNAIVVWTLRGPRSLLGPAREAARDKQHAAGETEEDHAALVYPSST